MTVLISHTPNFGDWNIVSTHKYGPDFSLAAGRLAKVSSGFGERSDGSLPEWQSQQSTSHCTRIFQVKFSFCILRSWKIVVFWVAKSLVTFCLQSL